MEEIIVEIPKGVEAHVHDRKISVKGPKGNVEKDFNDPRFNEFVDVSKQGDRIIVKYDAEKRKVRALAGSIRAHVGNMFHGVSSGYKYTMKIVYTHFPITITVEKGNVMIKNFLGAKGIRVARIIGKAEVHVDKESISVTGANIEEVSQTAANIEKACKITKRDRRIFQDGIYMDRRELATGEKI